MGRTRFVQPDSVTIQLGGGDWIEVKRRLTVGEERELMADLMGEVSRDGSRRFDAEALGLNDVCVYLVDWGGPGFSDSKGKTVAIADLTPAEKMVILKNLDPVDFGEIEKAIDTHKASVEAELAEAKKTEAGGLSGAPAPAATSSSASDSAGPTTIS